MAADPQYEKVHDLARSVTHEYGCHDKPRPIPDAPVEHSKAYGGSHPYKMSIDCMHDRSLTDVRCATKDGKRCKWAGTGETYTAAINAKNILAANISKRNSLTTMELDVIKMLLQHGPMNFMAVAIDTVIDFNKLVKDNLIVEVAGLKDNVKYAATAHGKDVYLAKGLELLEKAL